MASNQYFTGDHIRWLSLDLFEGLRWLHSAGVVHRDLKPANCLLEVKGVCRVAQDLRLRSVAQCP